MTVAVGHKVSRTAHLVLAEAAREAALRGTGLVVIEVIDSLDLDIGAAHRQGLLDETAAVLADQGLQVPVDARTVAGEHDVADGVLGEAERAGADLLVIGARKRSPVGKLLLGSATQRIILNADIPVLVVKTGD